MKPLQHALALAAAALVAGSAAAQATRTPDLRGVWWPSSPQPTLKPQGGGEVPFTEAGRKAFQENAAALRAAQGKPLDRNDLSRCLPLGPTRILSADFPLQIVQKGDQFVVIYEHNHAFEEVWLNEKPNPDRDWAYMGNSVGRWTTDGIEITTIGLKETVLLDDAGLPHGEKLVLRRTLRKLDGGRSLEVVTTIEDPEMYARPWSVRHTLALKPGERIQEYTCGQGPTLETRVTRANPPPPPPPEPMPGMMRPGGPGGPGGPYGPGGGAGGPGGAGTPGSPGGPGGAGGPRGGAPMGDAGAPAGAPGAGAAAAPAPGGQRPLTGPAPAASGAGR